MRPRKLPTVLARPLPAPKKVHLVRTTLVLHLDSAPSALRCNAGSKAMELPFCTPNQCTIDIRIIECTVQTVLLSI
jgi:hypothetical protein